MLNVMVAIIRTAKKWDHTESTSLQIKKKSSKSGHLVQSYEV